MIGSQVMPNSGMLQDGPGFIEFTITFDAGAGSISAPGVYTAGLVLETDDPIFPSQFMPITMTVLALEYGVEIQADITMPVGIPGDEFGVALHLFNTSEGMTDTIQLSLSQHSWEQELSSYLVGPIPSGGEGIALLWIRIPDSTLPGEQDAVVVEARSVGDPLKTDAVTITTTVLDPLADLELGLDVSPGPYWAGQPITYTATISNLGPTTAPDVVFVDVLSPKLLFMADLVDQTGGNGCELNGTVLSCQLGWIAAGGKRNITITAAPMHTGLLLNQAGVVSQASDPDTTNNFRAIQLIIEGFLWYFPLIFSP